MMNRPMTALTLIGLLSVASFPALAAETTTQGSAVPPAAIPGLNQSHSAESNEEKASKKGEEAAGSNSGSDAQTQKKEAEPSSNSKQKVKKQSMSGAEG